MDTLTKSEQAERLSPEDSDNEELRSSLNRLMEAAAAWKAERAQLVEERDQMRQLLDHTDEAAGIALERQITSAVDRIRSELTAENNQLRLEIEKLNSTASEWAAQRGQLMSELDHTRQLMGYTEEAAAIALERQLTTAVDQVKAELTAEAEQLRGQIRQLQVERSQMEEAQAALKEAHQRALKDSEKAAAVAQQKILDAAEQVRSELTAERDELRQELDAAIQLSAQRAAECAQLAAERDRAQQSIAETAESQRQALAESGKAAADRLQREIASAVERVRAELGAELESVRSQSETERRRLEAEVSRVKASLTKAETARANAISETDVVERKNSKLMEDCVRLREELESVSDAAVQKESEVARLKEECERAHRMLSEAKSAQPARNPSNASGAVEVEEARVEESIRELAALIDDPNTELSVVIRKTVERAQLDSYLKGLRFVAGK